jgi:hypothetical protein
MTMDFDVPFRDGVVLFYKKEIGTFNSKKKQLCPSHWMGDAPEHLHDGLRLGEKRAISGW